MKPDYQKGKLSLYHADCMEIMTNYPDGYFYLAIVDPPYGIEKAFNSNSRIFKYGDMFHVNDCVPTPRYFKELFRISNNQIVWGYNHLSQLLPKTKEFIFWHKHQPVKTYSDGELAWTSFKKTARYFSYPYFGTHGSDKLRIHPTQKPRALYRWLLQNYAKPGNKILDTHLGSGSHAIEAYFSNHCSEFVGVELDEDYFADSVKRIERETAQMQLFQEEQPKEEPTQLKLL